jgi:hypothetical protein
MYSKYKDYKQRQAGRRYEELVAQTLRQDGWQVNENGTNGIHDHGIDLIASKDGVRRYVQCKGWNHNKLIHEDVVSHLYGSVAIIEGPDNLAGVEIYLYSPATLDSYAEKGARILGINFVQLDSLAEHPKPRFHGYYRRRAKHHW